MRTIEILHAGLSLKQVHCMSPTAPRLRLLSMPDSVSESATEPGLVIPVDQTVEPISSSAPQHEGQPASTKSDIGLQHLCKGSHQYAHHERRGWHCSRAPSGVNDPAAYQELYTCLKQQLRQGQDSERLPNNLYGHVESIHLTTPLTYQYQYTLRSLSDCTQPYPRSTHQRQSTHLYLTGLTDGLLGLPQSAYETDVPGHAYQAGYSTCMQSFSNPCQRNLTHNISKLRRIVSYIE